MKLQTNELKQFKAVAGTLKQNSILPILSYLKFEKGAITKSNLESFVVMSADFEGSFLVDEKILFSFVESVSAKEIDVTVTEKAVVLSCGKEKITSPTEAVENFPAIMEAVGDGIEFNNELIEKIKVASAFTIERDNLPFTQCVFLGNGIVAASTGFIAEPDLETINCGIGVIEYVEPVNIKLQGIMSDFKERMEHKALFGAGV